jgi:catechol 2,3-dioxygenase-like lactoylglutathione lyase family enzyme
MTITLNHTIVPTRDKRAAAQFFARIFGLHADPKGDHFAPVRINDTLTLLFDDDEEFESHHYAFHVSDAEFDGIFGRVREAKLPYGSSPWSLNDGKLNDWNGGRGVYFLYNDLFDTARLPCVLTYSTSRCAPAAPRCSPDCAP